MWAPAERVFAAADDITLCALADSAFETDSAFDSATSLQLRPQAQSLAAHVGIAAAVMRSCSRCGIGIGAFYDALT